MRNINVQVYTYKNDIIASVKVDPFSTIVEFSGNLGFVEDRVPTVATCFNEGTWRKTYGDMYLDVLERRDWKEMIGDALTVAANAPSRDVKAL